MRGFAENNARFSVEEQSASLSRTGERPAAIFATGRYYAQSITPRVAKIKRSLSPGAYRHRSSFRVKFRPGPEHALAHLVQRFRRRQVDDPVIRAREFRITVADGIPAREQGS